MEGPCRRYGWCCNPIGHQPNYTHIPNEKAWNLREAVFLKSVCAALGDHPVGALCRLVGFSLKRLPGTKEFWGSSKLTGNPEEIHSSEKPVLGPCPVGEDIRSLVVSKDVRRHRLILRQNSAQP